MSAINLTVPEIHAEFDRRWSAAMKQSNACVACHRGCSACCSEPVYVNAAEARHVMDAIPVGELSGVIARTRVWLEKLAPTGLLQQREPFVLDWLRAGAVCPLLKNGECLVYAARPYGCRYHTAVNDASLCGSVATRMRQRYAENEGLKLFFGMLFVTTSGHMDNLGMFLARAFLSTKIKSGAELQLNLTASLSDDGETLKLVTP